MFVSKNFFEISFEKFCRVTVLFLVGIMIFMINDAQASRLKSANEVLLQKITKKSEQGLLSQKLRQEIEAYREKYSSKSHKYNETDPSSSKSENNDENFSDELNEYPTEVSQEEIENLNIHLIKKNTIQGAKE